VNAMHWCEASLRDCGGKAGADGLPASVLLATLFERLQMTSTFRLVCRRPYRPGPVRSAEFVTSNAAGLRWNALLHIPFSHPLQRS
jgi:hypothetical protein